MEKKEGFRIESDSMGQMYVPEQALWGPQTQRAVENFPVSGYRFPRGFIRALGLVKMASARANVELGLLDSELGGLVAAAAEEAAAGKWDSQFVLDIFQTGSGTSANMNANEVIANRAMQLAAEKGGAQARIHANDHVNMGQSSNDVIPACLHISAYESIKKKLMPALEELYRELNNKAEQFRDVVKLGRTHLQDATPVRLGQEFGGYAAMIKQCLERLEKTLDPLAELALGGTAVGTGLNAHPRHAGKTIAIISNLTACEFREAENHFAAQGSRDAVVEAHGAIKTAAVSLTKIANDIRWMGAGPYGNIAEILIPPVQPGSSIMPGKVNPVMAEALLQAAAQVMGNDTAITVAGMSGNFELNVMIPVMAHNILESAEILANAVSLFSKRCVAGIKADEKRCAELVEKSLAMVTALSPTLGYDLSAKIAKEAYETGKTLRQTILDKGLMSAADLDIALNPVSMT